MPGGTVGALNVSAIVVTRGDVDLELILDSFPPEWEKIVWDNSKREDLSVYGRYAAIDEASGDVIYVQDDDCVLAYPQAIVEQFAVPLWARADYVVCNMPQEFRHDFYQEHALVGFGAVFHRDAPRRAFERFAKWQALHSDLSEQVGPEADRRFHNTCDIVFTGLTPRILVDVPKTNLPWATDAGRMYLQPDHGPERARMLEWVREAKRGS